MIPRERGRVPGLWDAADPGSRRSVEPSRPDRNLLHAMSSFAALHLRARDLDGLVAPIGQWLGSHGFGAVEHLDSAPGSLESFASSANTVGLGRSNEEWSLLRFNGFNVGGAFLDEDAIRPLVQRLACRVVLFTAQTTSSVYQLVVFDGGTRVRRIAVSDGQVLHDDGERLPGERAGAFAGSDAEDEADDDPPSEMEDLTAIGSAMGFEIWPSPPIRGAVHVWRRRGLLSRLLGR